MTNPYSTYMSRPGNWDRVHEEVARRMLLNKCSGTWQRDNGRWSRCENKTKPDEMLCEHCDEVYPH